MKSFLYRLAIFLAIQATIAALLYRNSLNEPLYGFMSAFEDKIDLLENHDEPNLIIVGGSNIIFGIDSEVMEDQVGMPTINAGLHAGLGLQFFLNIAEKYARPGDIIVLIPEYPLLSSRLYPSEECSQELIRHSRSGWQYLLETPGFDVQKYIDERGLAEFAYNMQKGCKYYGTDRLRRRREDALRPGEYSRLNFNNYGDFVGHHGQPQADELRDIDRRYYFFPSYYAKTTAAINDCARACKAKGARMYFAYCPIPECVYDRSRVSINRAHRYLRENLDIPILHGPRKTLYPESSFYDSTCHLNESAKHERTMLVANELKRRFEMIAIRKERKKSKLR